MNKIYFYCLTVILALTGCATSSPNLVHTNKPILNITAELSPILSVDLQQQGARIENKSKQTVSFIYSVTWYDKQGVTQLYPQDKTEQQASLQLAPQQKVQLDFSKPTTASVNYRLYIATLNYNR